MSNAEDPIRFASIWAQDEDGVLGDGKRMLWRVPEDFKHFRARTLGHPIIMGRRSFEALGGALGGRTNIVLTSDQTFEAPNVVVARSIDEAFTLGRKVARETGVNTVWVAGGGKVYEETMDLVDELVVTHLQFPPGSATAKQWDMARLVRAPKVDEKVWKVAPDRTDEFWRPQSGDAKWKVVTYVRR